MSTRFLAQSDLLPWLAALRETSTLVAPARRAGRVVFAPVSSPDEVVLDAGRADFSAKEFFLPSSEAIVTWRVEPDGEGGRSLRTEAAAFGRPQVVFGMRPCDGHALSVLDRLLLADPVDLFYAERRARSTLVGLACAGGPWTGCFCTSVGGGPADPTHLDVLLTAVEGGFAVEVMTAKGRAVLEKARLSPFDGRTIPAPEAPEPRQVPGPEAWRAAFESPLWAELGERCLGCRTCTYDCPVCYCFDVRDRQKGEGRIERLRCWDSCQGASCFAIAGGHNPRPRQDQRQRQRYMHKFLYYPERERVFLCVGCGRCVADCPVNIDIREVLDRVAASGGFQP